MLVEIDPAFAASARGQALSPEATTALRGMLPFAMPHASDLSVDATAMQVAEWIGPESGLGRVPILRGIKELLAAGILSRKSLGRGQGRFTIAAMAVRRSA
jgi:hypothetical protein